MTLALRVFLAALLIILPIRAQQPEGADTTPRYQAIYSASLSAAANTVTVQQVAATSAQHNIVFETAWVYCSVACTFTIAQNGAAATATTLATSAMNQSPPSSATAWSASNGGGSPAFTSGTYYVAAAATYVVDVSKFYIAQNAGTKGNLTIATNSITGTAEIVIQWIEK